MSDTLKATYGRPGDPKFDAVFKIMNDMKAVTADFVLAQPDRRDGMSVVMTAAMMFAGAQAGALQSIGSILPRDKKRVLAAAQKNFEQGMKVGLAEGLRIGTTIYGGTA